MRRIFRFGLVMTFLPASLSVAQQPPATVMQNPYTATYPSIVHLDRVHVEQQSHGQTTVYPTSLANAEHNQSSVYNESRKLPDDCLKALSAAIRVRSPSQAYRATTAPMLHGRTVHSGDPVVPGNPIRHDPSVQPVTWVDDTPATATPSTLNPPLSRQSILAASRGETTRVTLNPYREQAVEIAPPPAPNVPTGTGNPLR